MSENNKENHLVLKLIEKLQDNLKDIWRPEFSDIKYIEKWLKARDYDLKKAETMLRTHINWRISENVDNILETYKVPEVFDNYGIGGYCGNDKEGRPVWYEAFGRVDPQGLLKSISSDDLLKSRIYIIEHMLKYVLPEMSKEMGHPVTESIALFDLQYFGRKHLWKPIMDCSIEAAKVMEANYPESLYKLYIFNAPSIFKVAYNIVKPFLNEVTRKKVVFLGKNFKEDILSIIHKDKLPAYYGGTMYGPLNDPMCSHLIRWGGEVPFRFYLTEHKQSMINIVVKPKSKVRLLFNINESDVILYYEYSTKDHDISFGIYYIGEEIDHEKDIEKIKSNHLDNVLHLQRKNSHIIIQKGAVESLRKGYYLIEFDNTYSWTRAKHVRYHIEVLDEMKCSTNQTKMRIEKSNI